GRIDDPQFLPVIYEFPQSMIDSGEARKPANFGLVNPDLGYSVDRAFLEREFRKAREAGEESLRGFLAKHLNIEVGLALLSNRWPGAEFWQAQERPGLGLEAILERCEVVDIGIDGGGLDDLLGLAVVGRDRETHEWLAWCKAWAHPSVLERRKDIAPLLQDFAKQGDLVLVNRIGEDVDEVADIVAAVYGSGLLDKVGVDPAGIGAILDAIIAAG